MSEIFQEEINTLSWLFPEPSLSLSLRLRIRNFLVYKSFVNLPKVAIFYFILLTWTVALL